MELGFNHFLVITITVVILLVIVFAHYEAIIRVHGFLLRREMRTRAGMALIVLTLMAMHVVEICLFGSAAWWLASLTEAGTISTPTGEAGFLDYIYLSATSFTTVGYGDLYPQGPMRFLYSSESLAGFALLTWSASATFLEMQRYFRALKGSGV